MKKMLLLSVLTFICLALEAYAQKENYNWYFGNFGAITFNTKDGKPVALLNSAMNANEGCASVSDKDGNLLFYTYGDSVWNKKHKIMKNGTGLMGSFTSTQSVIIVPFSDDSRFYYLFTVDYTCVDRYQLDSSCMNGFRYSIVDLSQDSGLGAVVKKNVLIFEKATEKLTAVKHSNNKDLWILIHEWGTNNFLAYLINDKGIQLQPVISSVGERHYSKKHFFVYYDNAGVGYMKVSKNSKKLATAIEGLDMVQIFDFDNSTGKVSNPITIKDSLSSDFVSSYGVEFSPDCSKLYVTSHDSYGKLIQLDLKSGDQEIILKTRTLLADIPDYFGALQTGPDNKIYCTYYGYWFLNVINKPDSLGLKSEFIKDGLYLGDKYHRGAFGLPQPILKSHRLVDYSISSNAPLCTEDTLYLNFRSNFPDSTAEIEWTGPDGFSSKSNVAKIENVSSKNKGWYYLTYNSSEIYFRDSIFVDIIAFPTAEIGINGKNPLCPGEAIELYAKNYDATCLYIWSDGSTKSLINVTEAGDYKLIVSNKFGCSDTALITIKSSKKPEVNIQCIGNPTFCDGDSVILLAVSDESGCSYLWSTGEKNENIIVKTSGLYSVTATNSDGCQGIAEISTNNIGNVAASIKGKRSLCTGTNTILIAEPSGIGYTYKWSTGEVTQSISAQKGGEYSVIVSLNDICSDTCKVMITEFPLPVVKIIGNEFLCPNSVVTLASDKDFVSYKWSTGETIREIGVSKSGTYSVEVTDSNGCAGSASFEVKEYVINISGFQNLDFGTNNLGSSTSKYLTIKNESNTAVNIPKVYVKSSSPDFKIITNPLFPSNLQIGGVMDVQIIFSPTEAKRYDDSLIVETDSPCYANFATSITGFGTALTLVSIPDTTGKVGEENFCIPLTAFQLEKFYLTENPDYIALVKFDATAYLPEYPSEGYILDRMRFIELKGSNVSFQNGIVKLGEICGTVLLAKNDRTPLIIDNFEWSIPGIETSKKDGSLTLGGVCWRSLSRIKLFEKNEITLSPNPATDYLEISYSPSIKMGLGGVSVEIFNVFGEKVLSYQYPNNLTPSLSPKERGVRIDVSGLSVGVYFVRVGASFSRFVKL